MINKLFKILFILACIFFAFCFSGFSPKIPLISNYYNNIYLNIYLESNKQNGFEVYINDKLQNPSLNSGNPYLIYKIENKPVYKISYKGNFKPDKIYLINGKDIQKFENNKKEDVLISTNEPINQKNPVQKFGMNFLSVFYNSGHFILPLALLALAFYFYRGKIKILPYILIIGIILRFVDLDYPLWFDELYTATMAGNPNLPLVSTFLDPNNPPLFYILSKIWILVFGHKEWVLRSLSSIFSILSIYALLILVKENISKVKIRRGFLALSIFLFSINLYSIYSGGEYRVYSLLTLLSIILAIFLFRIKKSENLNKNIILYSLTACLLANCHYYGVLIIICNFILGLFILENYKKKKFILANVIAGLSFLPWFICSFFMGKSLVGDFIPHKFNLLNIFYELYFSKTLAIIALIVFIRRLKFNLYFYSMYLILGLMGLTFILSFIKPCIRDYYFICLIPFVCITICYLFYLPIKKKALRIWFIGLILILCLNQRYFINRFDARAINLDLLYKFSYMDSVDKYYLLSNGISYFSIYYKDFIKPEAEIIEIPTQNNENEVFEIINSKNGVIYFKTDARNLLNYIVPLYNKRRVEYILGDNDIAIIKVFTR